MEKSKDLKVKKLPLKESLISWTAPEFVNHERNILWFVGAGTITFGLFAYSLYIRDWFFAATVVILVLVSLSYLKFKPAIRSYGISRVGITIDDKFYSYDELHSFWIVYRPPVKTLNILSTKKYMPHLSIQLEDEDPVMIRSVLSKFIPEQVKRGETIMDKITRILKF